MIRSCSSSMHVPVMRLVASPACHPLSRSIRLLLFGQKLHFCRASSNFSSCLLGLPMYIATGSVHRRFSVVSFGVVSSLLSIIFLSLISLSRLLSSRLASVCFSTSRSESPRTYVYGPMMPLHDMTACLPLQLITFC